MKTTSLLRAVLLAGGLAGSLYAENSITQLMQEYRDASELSRKTKVESLGHMSVFTRDELDYYQYNKLSDILKGLSFSNYEVGRYGWYNLFGTGTRSEPVTSLRLYLDDHELSVAVLGSPTILWGELPLDMIDHVEVYQHSGSVRLGNEPGLTIVKMYSKKPERDEGVSLRVAGSNRGDREGGVFLANPGDKWAVTSYIGGAYNDPQNYTLNGGTVSHERNRRYAFIGITGEHTAINMGYLSVNQDPFAGVSIDLHPSDGFFTAQGYYASLKQKFLDDDSLTVSFQFDSSRAKLHENSATALLVPLALRDGLDIPQDLRQSMYVDQKTFNISKEWKTRSHDAIVGLGYKDITNKVTTLDVTGYDLVANPYFPMFSSSPLLPTPGSDNLVPYMQMTRKAIASAYAEDTYSLTESVAFVVGGRIEKNSYSSWYSDDIRHHGRAGVIAEVATNQTVKAFVSKTQLAPIYMDIVQSDTTQKLKPETTDSLSAEWRYDDHEWSVDILGALMTTRNSLVYDGTTYKVVNAVEDPLFQRRIAIDVGRKVSADTKISCGYWFSQMAKPLYSSPVGAHLKGYTSWGALTMSGEVVYRQGYDYDGYHIGDGYRVNLAAAYPITRTMTVKLKGENLFDKAQEVGIKAIRGGIVPSYDPTMLYDRQRVIAQMEWGF